MSSKYSFIKMEELKYYMPLIKELKVSVKARSPHQFLDIYKKYGTQLPIQWKKKRDAFIDRHYAQYKENPTIRRRLALITWAFDPFNYKGS